MTHIAYLGTGLLGSGFVEAAAKRGERIAVWNRTEDKACSLERFGVRVADTPADAVRGATRVHVVLKDDAVVEQVLAAARPGLGQDTIIVDHTTTQPKLTADRSARLIASGVRYIHCPVFIGPAAARKGLGTILASGPRDLFDAVKPALSAMAERVEYFGERADLAAIYKLSGNAFIIGVTALAADVFALASSSGLAATDALRVLDFLNPTAMINSRGKAMIAHNYEPGFEIAMARKDVRLMIETAGDKPLAALPGIAARMDHIIAEGRGADDLAVIGKDSV
ncbi:MAG TPA: NAD(P)-dependent oxidoreductase [Gemmatimonadaceae bacterium]